VKSEWLREQADVGKRRRMLVPVLIDNVGIPLCFGWIQAASLLDWQRTLPHPGFEQLSEAVARIVGYTPHSVTSRIVKQEEAERLEQEH
jgi:hypothetical protein